jgi:hypothetical protein
VIAVKTTYVVRLPDGVAVDALDLDSARRLVTDNPGATCDPVVHYRPCPEHRSYEVGNCPSCDEHVRSGR